MFVKTYLAINLILIVVSAAKFLFTTYMEWYIYHRDCNLPLKRKI